MATALVPVKRLDRAKTRLAGALDLPARGTLMRALLADVVGVLHAAPSIERVVIATSDPAVPALARTLGAQVVSDGDLPWNEGLAHAIGLLQPRPSLVAIVAADLPVIEAVDVERLVAAVPPRGVAVARAHDAGSNALALRPPDALVPNFGAPGSAALHAQRARAAGLEAVILDLPSLAVDLDTPEDVDRVRRLGGDGRAVELLLEAMPWAGVSATGTAG